MPPAGRVAAAVEAGSFRDPDSRVFLRDGAVYRALSRSGWADWEALAATPLVADDRLIATEPADVDDLPELAGEPAAGALRHERVPFVSYPYEWPFSMLKDAALLQLAVGRRALEHDLTLKDASAYNIQWRGAKPVFIDVGSFERLREGEPWAGYRQFCMLFLYPLMLQAYKRLPYHALLRGSLDGIAPRDARAVMSVARPAPPWRAHPRPVARPARGPLCRRRRSRGQARAQARRLRQGAARRQPAPPREARRAARVPRRAHGVDRVRLDEHVHRRGRRS